MTAITPPTVPMTVVSDSSGARTVTGISTDLERGEITWPTQSVAKPRRKK
jgi:hypothetical protein